MNEQEFRNEFEPIKKVLAKQDIIVNADDYDGVVVKMLECTNTRGCGDTTHIEFTGEQMDMFPYLAPYTYFKDYQNYGDQKSFYVFKMPLFLNKLNLKYLLDNQDNYARDYFAWKGRQGIDEDQRIRRQSDLEKNIYYLEKTLSSEKYQDVTKIDSHSTLLRGEKETGSHMEISQIKSDDELFQSFRWIMPLNSYIIILKLRKEVEFEIYGVLPNDAEEISHLHLQFNYYHTARGKKTLVPLESFDIPISEEENEDSVSDADTKNLLLYGVPGCGKSWTIKNKICKGVDEKHVERIVFHPDYTYSDFVGQILPKVSADGLQYEFTCGPFTSILRKAESKPDEKFYLIIEEINRGNAPAIFGDIFQLLDRMDEDKDGFRKGTSEFPITNEDIADKVYGDKNHKVRIPSNLSIIATMNTSDQNVFTLDTAFQRRWDMEMIENKIDDKTDDLFKETIILDTGMSWKNFCYGINKKILENNNNLSSSEDKRLGTYFIKSEDFEYNENEDNEYRDLLKDKSRKFSEKVLKYLWDDAFKFSRNDIFNEVQYPSLDAVIKEFNNKTGKERFNVFKNGLYDELINIDFSIGDEKGE